MLELAMLSKDEIGYLEKIPAKKIYRKYSQQDVSLS